MITVRVRDGLLEIRPIGPEDVDAVLALYRQCEDFLALGPVPTASKEMVVKDFATSQGQSGHFCGIYTADDDMIGIVDYVPSHFEGDPRTGFLSLLMIAAPLRRRGIGYAIVEAVEHEILTDTQVHTIRSGVQVNNPHAVRFWQSQGYRIVSGPERLPDQTTVFSLQKDVRSSSGHDSAGHDPAGPGDDRR